MYEYFTIANVSTYLSKFGNVLIKEFQRESKAKWIDMRVIEIVNFSFARLPDWSQLSVALSPSWTFLIKSVQSVLTGLQPPTSLLELADKTNVTPFYFAVKMTYLQSQICVSVLTIVSKCVYVDWPSQLWLCNVYSCYVWVSSKCWVWALKLNTIN